MKKLCILFAFILAGLISFYANATNLYQNIHADHLKRDTFLPVSVDESGEAQLNYQLKCPHGVAISKIRFDHKEECELSFLFSSTVSLFCQGTNVKIYFQNGQQVNFNAMNKKQRIESSLLYSGKSLGTPYRSFQLTGVEIHKSCGWPNLESESSPKRLDKNTVEIFFNN